MATKKLKKLILNGEAYNLPTNSDYVDLSSAQTVGGVKTFTSAPVIPSKTTDATNTWTAIASEAQVYKKQDSLTLEQSPTQWHLVLWWANNKTLVDWWEPTAAYPEVSKSDMDTGTGTTPWVVAAKSIADYVSWRLSSTYVYKWSVATYADLPATWQAVWDVYNVEAAHTTDPKFPAWSNVAWNGTAWDVLWGIFDVSNLVDLTSNQTIWGTKTFTTSPVVPSKTTDATNTWTSLATEAQVYKKLDSADLWNATITFKQGLDNSAIWTLTTNQSSNWTITMHDNVPKTQNEYDNLPSSKATDWNSYWIYESVA